MENLSRLELVQLWKKLKRKDTENVRADTFLDVEVTPDLEEAENLLLKKYQIEPSELYF